MKSRDVAHICDAGLESEAASRSCGRHEAEFHDEPLRSRRTYPSIGTHWKFYADICEYDSLEAAMSGLWQRMAVDVRALWPIW